MASKSPSLEPTIIIVHSDPEKVAYLDEIVFKTLDVCGTCFIDSRLAHEWCIAHPAAADLIIVKETMPEWSGVRLLKSLDAIIVRPVYSIFLIDHSVNEAHAQEWYYGLDRVFSMVRPLRAVRYPYLMHSIAMALHEAFPWRIAEKHQQQNHNQDSGIRNGEGLNQ
jgi:hypothetical protein